MEYRHEIIDFGENVPVKCFIHQLGYSARHWHSSMELLFVLKGSVEITVTGGTYQLEEGDVILVNANEPHELSAEGCILAAVQIKLSLFGDKLIEQESLRFDCNSRTHPGNPGLHKIKRIMAQFVKNYATTDDSRMFRAKSLSYALLAELNACFKVEGGETEQTQSRVYYERITRIVHYLNAHYHEDVTLQSLAEQEYLSVPYLSKFFTRMMGMGFSAYLNQLRLMRAVFDLTSTSLTIEAIAERNGFSNTQAFVQLFKKKYGMLPSQYRKQDRTPEGAPLYASGSFNEYTILDAHQYLDYFAAYLDKEESEALPDEAAPDITSHYSVDETLAGTPLRHTWRSYTAMGSARDLLVSDVQEMLRALQGDVGFRYIKFHGILSDDMHVCTKLRNGELSFSFVYVDKALDFLRSLGLRPLIQLSFMPAVLAADPDHYIFDSTMINSPPRRMEEWCQLVEAFLRHIIGRYGAAEVEQWPLTVWNEPDTPQSMFGFPSEEAFYDFYARTYETVRGVHPAMRIGTPSSYFDPVDSGSWLRRFSAWCREHDCVPDFILFHYYGTNITVSGVEEKGRFINAGRIELTTDENRLRKSIDMIVAYAHAEYPSGTPVYLTEWNFSPSHHELLGDTCFRSCYLVKNILENYDRLESMGYWLLTDMFEEYQLPMETFHGGLGLFTYNGIKKPAYYALWLLAKLGDTLIGSGDGYFLTRQGGGYQLMLYNYKHFSDLYASGEMFDMTFTNRYTPFAPEQKRDFDIRVEGVAPGPWRVLEYTINRQSGSCFDKWVEMGAQSIESQEEVELLESLSRPMITRYTVQAGERGLTVNAILEPLEVRLILLTKG